MALSPGFAGHAGLVLREGQAAGDGLHVWLHAAEAAAHEFHAPGTFAGVVAAMDAARGREVAVSTLLTRSNARVLAAVPGWLHARAVHAWRVVVPRVVGAPRRGGAALVADVGALDGLVPRLSVALPYALHALAAARRLGIGVAISGAPDCLLGPFAGVTLAAEPGQFAAVCDGCAARPRCAGVDAAYLRRFAGDELSPRGLRPREGAPAPARLFAGTGALEQVETDMSPETGASGQGGSDMSPGTGARRLPVLRGGP